MFFRTPVESPRVPDEPPGTLLGLIAATCMSLGTVQLCNSMVRLQGAIRTELHDQISCEINSTAVHGVRWSLSMFGALYCYK